MKKPFIAIVVLSTLLSLPSLEVNASLAGNDSGGGSSADMVKRNKVVSLINLIIADFETWAAPNFPEVEIDQLKQVRDTAVIEFTTEPLFILKDKKKVLVDALNFPDKMLIKINKHRISRLSLGKLKALLLHEFLGLLKVSDKKYKISIRYLNFLDVKKDNFVDSPIFRFGVQLDNFNLYGEESRSYILSWMALTTMLRAFSRNLNGFSYVPVPDNTTSPDVNFIVRQPVDQDSPRFSIVESEAEFVLDPSEGYCKEFGIGEGRANETVTRGVLSKILESLIERGMVNDYSLTSISDPGCNSDDVMGAFLLKVSYNIWHERTESL